MSSVESVPVLLEDELFVVVNKPAGLISVPYPGHRGRTCLDLVQKSHRGARAVHRLDRETSGAMLFARNKDAHGLLLTAFKDRQVDKRYLALIRGHLQAQRGTIRLPIVDLGKRALVRSDGRPAMTHYRVLQKLKNTSLVEAHPVTGRYNQIRLHFAHLNHALIGERKYARGKDSPVSFRRVALHASRLEFPHPGSQQKVRVEAPLADDFQQLLKSLGGR
jgi:RluA family pseudouridine synthase